MPPVAGVDGARHGWVVALLGPAGPMRSAPVRWVLCDDACGVLVATAGCSAVGVDIPLGLPGGRRRRACDVLAAARLGPARASVFAAPPRAVLDAPDYASACAAARAATGRAISRQAWNIIPKTAEWDTLALPAAVVEVHPEVSFRTLGPSTGYAAKRTARGAGQRIAALAEAGLDMPSALADLPDGPRLDDVLDALAVAWSARRWASGTAEVLGGEPDEHGRPMRIVA